jgi:acetyl-CoA carboxylase biotin carboxyl carrier protein
MSPRDRQVRVVRRDDGKVELRSPAVGLWREAPARGSLVFPGSAVGRLEVLGELHPLSAPPGAHGLVLERGADAEGRARRPVGYDDLLLVLDPEVGQADAELEAEAEAASNSGGLSFRAPSSGRFYARPAPDKPPFVKVGDEIRSGQTVAVLEVMKTFNRVQYGGGGLPDPARVVAVVPSDGDDLASGDPILEVEPVA